MWVRGIHAREKSVHQQQRRYFLKLLAGSAALSLTGLHGCSAPQQRLAVGSHVWLGYEPMFLARQLGYLDNSGVRLVELPSATDSIHALHSGHIDAAALTLDEVLTARDDGLELQVAMVFNTSIGADQLLVRPNIETLADLNGKRIVVEQTAVGALMLASVLGKAGLTLDDITRLHVTHDGHVDAWENLNADAMITFEPAASQIRDRGGRVLFSSQQIPERIVNVLAVRKQVLPEKCAVLSKLIEAHFLAVEHLKKLPQDAAERMATRLELSPAGVLTAFKGIHLPDLAQNCAMLGPPEPSLLATAEQVQDIMQRYGLLRQRKRVDDLINASALQLLREDRSWSLTGISRACA